MYLNSSKLKNMALTTEKITVKLTSEQIKKLKDLANDQGITATAALQRAIETENFIRQEIKTGAKILVQHQNKKVQQIIFR